MKEVPDGFFRAKCDVLGLADCAFIDELASHRNYVHDLFTVLAIKNQALPFKVVADVWR